MKFDETDSNISSFKSTDLYFIFFLIKDDDVVYIGQTSKGISIPFPFPHCDKDFDIIKIMPCPFDMLDSETYNFICKYKPIYNREIWRKIKDFPLYSVSNEGRVRNDKKKTIRKIFIDKDGYNIVVLTQNGSSKTCRIHKLVANAFVPNPDNKPCVDHIDTNKLNNNANNLRWVTHKENNNNPLTKLHRLQSQLKTKRKISEVTSMKTDN